MERQPFKVSAPLAIYVIYHYDDAHLNQFIVRRLNGGTEPEVLALVDDLDAARAVIAQVAPSARNFGRGEHDDPAIKEMWQ